MARSNVPDLTQEYQDRHNQTVKPNMQGRDQLLQFDRETGELRLTLLTSAEKKIIDEQSKIRLKGYKEDQKAEKQHLNELSQTLKSYGEQKKQLEEQIKTATTQAQEDALKVQLENLKKQLQQQEALVQQQETKIAHTATLINKEKVEAAERAAKAEEVANKNLYANLDGIQKIAFQETMAMNAKKIAEETRVQKLESDQALKRYDSDLKSHSAFLRKKKQAVTDIEAELSQANASGASEDQINEIEERLIEAKAEADSIQKEHEDLKEYGKKLREDNKNLGKVNQNANNMAQQAETQAQKLKEYSYNGQLFARKEALQSQNASLKGQNAEAMKNIAIDTGRKEELEKKGSLSEEEQAELAKLTDNISKNKKSIDENNKQLLKNNTELAKQKLAENAQKAIEDSLNKIDSTIDALYKDSAKFNARLYGASVGRTNVLNAFLNPLSTLATMGQQYNKLLNTVSGSLGINPLVSQQAVIKNVQQLINAGVAQNIELRAYLATISDQVASTFNALDKTLLRLQRIQQADTTAIRLGMEAALNEFFNKNFADTTFMQDIHDGVFDAIYDANSLMTKEESAEFEYIVQKWLGSLYSLGMSQQGVDTIAKGINYLGTGDYAGMAGDEKLQNIFAMSASRAGLNYAELLQKGIDKSSVNKLMEAMVGYLRDIAQNTIDNKVVASAFSNVFGMSVSDMSSILNLSDQDIQNIAKNTLSYEGMGQNLISSVQRIMRNTHVSQLTNNLMENLITTAATGIGDSVVNYAIWKIAGTLMDLGIDVDLPFVNVWGFGIDLHTTLLSLVKLGVTGIGILGQLLSGVFSGGGSLMSLIGYGNIDTMYNAWNATQITERGETRQEIIKGNKRYQSYSMTMVAPLARTMTNLFTDMVSEEDESSSEVGGGNTEDIQNSALTQASDDAKENSEVTGGNEGAPEHTMDDLYDALFTYHFPIYTLDVLGIGKIVGSTSTEKSYSSTYKSMLSSMFDIPELAGDTERNSTSLQSYQSNLSKFSEITQDVIDMSLNDIQTVNLSQATNESLQEILTKYLAQLLSKLGFASTGNSLDMSNVSEGGGNVSSLLSTLSGTDSAAGSMAETVNEILSILRDDNIKISIESISPAAQLSFV